MDGPVEAIASAHRRYMEQKKERQTKTEKKI